MYKKNGQLRFPVLLIYVGRGAGKNGFLGFEDFCLLTPVNGIKHYNIDIFAMSENRQKCHLMMCITCLKITKIL